MGTCGRVIGLGRRGFEPIQVLDRSGSVWIALYDRQAENRVRRLRSKSNGRISISIICLTDGLECLSLKSSTGLLSSAVRSTTATSDFLGAAKSQRPRRSCQCHERKTSNRSCRFYSASPRERDMLTSRPATSKRTYRSVTGWQTPSTAEQGAACHPTGSAALRRCQAGAGYPAMTSFFWGALRSSTGTPVCHWITSTRGVRLANGSKSSERRMTWGCYPRIGSAASRAFRAGSGDLRRALNVVHRRSEAHQGAFHSLRARQEQVELDRDAGHAGEGLFRSEPRGQTLSSADSSACYRCGGDTPHARAFSRRPTSLVRSCYGFGAIACWFDRQTSIPSSADARGVRLG